MTDDTTLLIKKRDLILEKIETGHKTKDKYFKKMCQYNSINTKLDTLMLSTGTIGTTLIISSVTILNPIVLTIGSVFNVLSVIFGSIQKGIDTRNKYESYRNTYLQMSGLISNISSKLIHNNISNEEYNDLYDQYNREYQLILEGSIPIN